MLRLGQSITAVQPCASRTAIIAARMSFQVCGFIIVLLGNMQPSQQMCWNFLVSLPCSSRSQKPATLTMSSLPLGSFGRQWRPVLSCEPVPCTVRVVLGDVEIDRPGAQRGGQLLERRVERGRVLPVEVGGQDRVFRRVVAQHVQQRVGHVGLEAERLAGGRPFPAAGPCAANCACRPSRFRPRRPAARRGPRRSSQASRNVSAIRLRVGLADRPAAQSADAAGRVDPHDAVGADAELAQPSWRCGSPCGPASRNFLRSLVAAHRRAAAGRRPDRRDDRADHQIPRCEPCRPAASGRRPTSRC